MKMSDKELDKLFSSQLADMEIEPSAAVWSNISCEISGEEASIEKKKSIMPFLQIAAGVIVLMSIAFIFRPKTEKVALYGDYTASVTGSQRPLVITPQTTDMIQNVQIQDATNSHPMTGHYKSERPYSGEEQIVNAAIDTTTRVLANNVVTDVNTTATQPDIADRQAIGAPRVITAIQGGVDHIKPNRALAVTDPPTLKDNTGKKKKIRSIGDLFNVMIAKVDKRPNKIIQFENNEEEEGDFGVSGVNLGPIQIKKNE